MSKLAKRNNHRYRVVSVSPHTIACARPDCRFLRRWDADAECMSMDGGVTWGPASHYLPTCPVEVKA